VDALTGVIALVVGLLLGVGLAAALLKNRLASEAARLRAEAEAQLAQALGGTVKITGSLERGVLSVHYQSSEQLSALAGRLGLAEA